MGSTLNKYRVHEVAKDFGIPTKTVTEILTKYASAPKNHMQVLSDEELSIIFDYLTQHNQVSGIEVIFSEVYQEEKPAPQPEQPAKAGGLLFAENCACTLAPGRRICYNGRENTERESQRNGKLYRIH